MAADLPLPATFIAASTSCNASIALAESTELRPMLSHVRLWKSRSATE
jgi:hypothetical protein